MSRYENQKKPRKKWRYVYRKFSITQRFNSLFQDDVIKTIGNNLKDSCAKGHRQQSARTLEMFFCCVVGCSDRSEKCSSKSFTDLQQSFHIMTKKQAISSKRRSAWFSNIKRVAIDTSASLYRVCSDHFVNGKCF